MQYLVKWEGYSARHNTWEPEQSFLSSELCKEFNNQRNHEQREPRAERAAGGAGTAHHAHGDAPRTKRAAAEATATKRQAKGKQSATDRQ